LKRIGGAPHSMPSVSIHAAVRQSLAAVRITLFPQPAALRPWPTRETLARHDARRPRRISLRGGAQRDRAYTAPGRLHTFGRPGSVVEGAQSNVARKAKGRLEHEIRHAAETHEA